MALGVPNIAPLCSDTVGSLGGLKSQSKSPPKISYLWLAFNSWCYRWLAPHTFSVFCQFERDRSSMGTCAKLQLSKEGKEERRRRSCTLSLSLSTSSPLLSPASVLSLSSSSSKRQHHHHHHHHHHHMKGSLACRRWQSLRNQRLLRVRNAPQLCMHLF